MYSEITGGVVGGTEQARSGYKKREGAPPRLGAGRLPSGGGTDAGRAPCLADDGGTVSPADGRQKGKYLISH